MTWYPRVDVNASYEIEWSPDGGMNLRARYRGEGVWKYCECDDIEDSIRLAEELLRRDNEQVFVILDYVYFEPDG